ncbi:hypothetical protein [Catellatospora sp. TT07R-123]|nr:hypothetical protein [Catellatospora sp. TT07R-123]
MRIVADAPLADPDDGGAVVGEQGDRLVGDAGAGSEQQHAH